MSVTLLFSYGTYANGATVTLDRATELSLVQQGRATYVVNPGPVFAPLSAVEQQAVRDSLVSIQALAAGVGFAPNGQTVAAIGDSLQANGFTLNSAAQISQNSALNWGLALLKQAIWLPFGCSSTYTSGPADIVNYSLAVAGTSSLDAINLQIGPAALLKAGWWSVQTGTNDTVLRPADSALIICNRLRTIVNAGLAAGANVMLWTIPPKNDAVWQTYASGITSAGSTVVAQRLKQMSVNQWIRRYAQETPGVVLIDPFTELTDPASATSDWISGYSTDGTHWNNAGAFVAGTVMANAMAPFVKPALLTTTAQSDAYNSVTNISGNFALSAGFLGTGVAVATGVTGTTPTGWTVDPQSGAFTALCAAQARSDSVGNSLLSAGRELQIGVSATSGAGQLRAYAASTGAVIPANTPFYAEVLVSVSANTGAWGGPSLTGFFNAGSNTVFPVGMNPDGTNLPLGATFDAVIRTPITRCTSTTGGLMFTYMNLAVGSAATMKIRRINLRIVDATLPGLVLGTV